MIVAGACRAEHDEPADQKRAGDHRAAFQESRVAADKTSEKNAISSLFRMTILNSCDSGTS